MDFFEAQDHARKSTKLLVFLFLIAVLSIICFANILVALYIFFSSDEHLYSSTFSFSDFFLQKNFWYVTLVVSGVICSAIYYKWSMISEGGRTVAEALGGRRILPGTDDPCERVLLNIVEEMALASGMPVPPVYVLENEKGINAFAAGLQPSDGVIGVTRGCLDILNREQLQGVIAHEFSHILNGDMRLNFRLLALLNGIVFIGGFGKFLLRSSQLSYGMSWRKFGGFRVLLLGFFLVVVGWIGIFFGSLIKTAINRQREYLADASAVQFTRNPGGIGDALRKIGGYSGGSKVMKPGVDDVSHLFVANALSGFELFCTHPPIEKRISKLLPEWDGEMIPYRVKGHENKRNEKDTKSKEKSCGVAASMVLATVASSDEYFSGESYNDQKVSCLDELLQYTSDPLSSIALMYGLAFDKQLNIQHIQYDLLAQQDNSPYVQQKIKELVGKLAGIDPSWRIVLIERAIPSLKGISLNQYKNFKQVLLSLIRADEKIDLFEWCLYQLLTRYLDANFGLLKKKRARFSSMHDLSEAYEIVLSSLVLYGHGVEDTLKKAFTRGATTAGMYNIRLLDFDDCTMKRFNTSVNELAQAVPMLKARILKGLSNAAEFDEVISPVERELITAIAATMDSPLPRIRQQQNSTALAQTFHEHF